MSSNTHILLSRPFDLEAFDEAASRDESPRHTMSDLAKALDAKVHSPSVMSHTLLDKMKAKFPGLGTAEIWAMVRHLSKELDPASVVFSIGEDTGLPLACTLPKNGSGPKLVVFFHNPTSARVRLLFPRYGLVKRITRVVTNTESKAKFLRDELGFEADRVFCIDEQTDTRFFTPGAQSPEKSRVIIGSGGLEQRDYVTLAAATKDLDADLRVCAVSPNATAKSDTFPSELPSNMSVDHYEWRALRQLYRDSDVVVISLKQHDYQAGLTTLFEALSCKRPVIMTQTAGLVERFSESGYLTAVPPKQPLAMKQAIEAILADPEAAQRQAERGHAAVTKNYTSERYVQNLVEQVTLAKT